MQDLAATPNSTEALIMKDERSDWIRLRTLLLLRWLAIGGQTIAVVSASLFLGLNVELGLCFLAIGASVISNLVAMTIFPENQRLSDRDAMLTLLFDLSQLAFLLFLTGGLNNPFALLLLAPVTISATALTLRSTLTLGVIGTVLITLLIWYHLPLRTANGEILTQPPIFVAGFWTSILIGLTFLSLYARRVTLETHTMSQALLATQMALAREQNLHDLGGVVAAAAHELGTPLATIKLVSTELADELADQEDLKNDAELIREQADRCRAILQSMGRAGKEDAKLKTAPFTALLEEAAEPHSDRGIELIYDAKSLSGPTTQPMLFRTPEVIHGLRNLVQNAVDFAKEQVWVEAQWDRDIVRLRLTDDGDGFPPDLLGRLGDPFLRRRKPKDVTERPGYKGMGLGLFIAKTLLERSGARVEFFNASDTVISGAKKTGKTGAVVEVTWPTSKICAPDSLVSGPLGENQPLTA